MKEIKKIPNKKSAHRKLPLGFMEFLVAIGIVAIMVVLIVCTRSCAADNDIKLSVTDNVFDDDTSVSLKDTPNTTILTPIPVEEINFPFSITDDVNLESVYTATGYFPEDGSDEAIENILAVKLTNTSDKTLEYLTFSLAINGENYKFSISTIPAEKSVYTFNTERIIAPEKLNSLDKAIEYEIYFAEEPSVRADTLSYEIQNGSIIVTNISDRDIKSDIMLYYKVTTQNVYLGGITYRLRISGGLTAGQSYSAYAPHAYANMTEIMFTQYEK